MLIVNLFGGPGCGKSTTAAGVFYLLKSHGINCEYVHEEAKGFVWEKRSMTLACQPYIFGKQMRNLWRLRDQVSVAITDSPLLLSLVYCGPEWPEEFKHYVAAQFKQFHNVNFLLDRGDLSYNARGRNQTTDEALEIDDKIRKMLVDTSTPHSIMPVQDGTAQKIAAEITTLVWDEIF